jgi:putative intracellular protease/amidase
MFGSQCTENGVAVSDMVVDADALADGLRAVHLAGPTRAMDEPAVRDASWIRARDRAAIGDDEDQNQHGYV